MTNIALAIFGLSFVSTIFFGIEKMVSIISANEVLLSVY